MNEVDLQFIGKPDFEKGVAIAVQAHLDAEGRPETGSLGGYDLGGEEVHWRGWPCNTDVKQPPRTWGKIIGTDCI